MDHPTPLVTILDAIAEELADLGGDLDNLQMLLSPAMFEIAKNAEYAKNVQALDLMSQRLAAISAFVFSLNLSIPGHCTVNSGAALEDVKLSALALRLAGAENAAAYQPSGDLDLF